MQGHVTPTDERLARTAAIGTDDSSPVVMLNLNRYRDRAQYPDGTADADVSGREAYLRYGVVAFAAPARAWQHKRERQRRRRP